MNATTLGPTAALTLKVLRRPDAWPLWPMLPVVKGRGAARTIGVVLDTRAMGLTGYSSTVFKVNLFDLPDGVTVMDVNDLPKEVFDSADEIVAAGWTID